jgi:hypothetical protein
MTTEEFMQAYLGATEEQRAAALAALQGRTAAGLANPEPIDRILSPEAVAEILNLTTRSLRSYARRGEIKRAYLSGNKRGWGYWESSVRDFQKRRAAIQQADGGDAIR